MAKSNLEKLVWVPRCFSVLYALFLMIFSAKAFSSAGEYDNFLMRSLPSLLMLAIVFITWNKPKLTGVFFLTLAIGFVAFFIIDKATDTDLYTLMGGVPAILGILFLTFGKNKTKAKKAAVQEAPAPAAEEPAEAEPAEKN